jgi:SAM-dependent methyltransferase
MDNAYRSPQKSQAYQDFLGSSQGQEFQAVLGEAFLKAVTNSVAKTENFSLLDAGCGDGWLAQKIFQHFPSAQISGFDLSQPLIDKAKRLAPQINFQTADLNLPFPFEPASFDIVLASMVLHDTDNEIAALKNLAASLKPGGTLLASIVNPYYGYPVGEWKRGLWGFLFRQRPKLKLNRSYNRLAQLPKVSFAWRENLHSYFTPLSRHLEAIKQAGMYLESLDELSSQSRGTEYGLGFQLYQYPILLLMQLRKLPK